MRSLSIALNPTGVTHNRERGMHGITDQAVVEKVVKGDNDAFGVLVSKYQDRIYSAVYNYVSNPEDAVDITQDAFVKAYSKLGSFDRGSTFYTWLYRIAVNTAIDFLRKRKSRPADSLDDDKYTDVGFEPVSKDIGSDPVSVLNSSEQQRVLKKAISSLSEKLRTVVVLHDVEGLSQEEVADILKIPVGTVKSRVSRGRAELRNLLRRQIGDAI